MKGKIKKILKNRIFLFVLGILISGSVSVFAVTYFPSNQVTYNNGASGLKSTDVQGAIDELYGVCTISKGSTTSIGGITIEVSNFNNADGLYKDEYEEGRYFYKGTNPDNYITFNGEKAGWRILSLESDGTMKIIRRTKSSCNRWSYYDEYDFEETSWEYPTYMNTCLNSTYYNELNSTAQNQIVSHNWNVGNIKDDKYVSLNRQIDDENSKQWNGKVGLITLSEYIRASGDVPVNLSICGSRDTFDPDLCVSINWIAQMLSGVYYDMWIITSDNTTPHHIYRIEGKGRYSTVGSIMETNPNVTTNMSSYPVVYLKADLKLSGTGTQSDPYVIE